jgi:AcrR family transcriptional regulator
MKVHENVRTAIILAAKDHFARYGMSKTTVDEVAKLARMGKSTLYYYFRSKEEIFKAVLEYEAGDFIERIDAAVAQEHSPEKKLRTYIMVRMHLLKQLVNVHTALKDDYLSHYAFIQKIRESFDQYEIALVSDILGRGVHQGLFRIEDMDLTAFTIVTVLKGLEYEWTIRVPEEQIVRNIDKLLDILLNGIAIRPVT